MKQLTLRGFDDGLTRQLEELAQTHSISLNKAALILMRRGAGLGATDLVGGAPSGGGSAIGPAIGFGLDRFIGVWSEGEEREFLASIASLDDLDPELWS